MTLKSRFDYLAFLRELHLQAIHMHDQRSCTLCWLCQPYEHTHSATEPVPGCVHCYDLVGDAMLDEAMRECANPNHPANCKGP